MTRAYTYRDGKLTSPLLRALNAAGGMLEILGAKPGLSPDAIVADAIEQAGSADLGGDSYREPLERLTDSLENESNLSTFGRLAVRKMITSQLVTRIRLHE